MERRTDRWRDKPTDTPTYSDAKTYLMRLSKLGQKRLFLGKKVTLRPGLVAEWGTSVLFFLPGIMFFAYNYVVYMRFFAFKPKRVKKKEIIVF